MTLTVMEQVAIENMERVLENIKLGRYTISESGLSFTMNVPLDDNLVDATPPDEGRFVIDFKINPTLDKIGS